MNCKDTVLVHIIAIALGLGAGYPHVKIQRAVPKERRCKPWTAVLGFWALTSLSAAQSLPGTAGLN